MKKISALIILVTSLPVGSAWADLPTKQDYFNCYQGFNGFPVSSKETGLQKPFFVIPLPTGDEHTGKDSFMILNASGAQEVLTDNPEEQLGAHRIKRPRNQDFGQTKADLLTLKPAGERDSIELDFVTQPDRNSTSYHSWIGRNDDQDYQSSTVHQHTVERTKTQATRPLDLNEEATFFRFAIKNKLEENEAELANAGRGGLRSYLLDNLKAHSAAKKAQLIDSMEKLSACRKIVGSSVVDGKIGEVELAKAIAGQIDVINSELDLIDSLNKKPSTGRPTGGGITGVAAPAQ